jgi:hypothetical protein
LLRSIISICSSDSAIFIIEPPQPLNCVAVALVFRDGTYMSAKRLSFIAVAAVALRDAFTHPSYWIPALLLLAPTLVLQLAVPNSRSGKVLVASWLHAGKTPPRAKNTPVMASAGSAISHAVTNDLPYMTNFDADIGTSGSVLCFLTTSCTRSPVRATTAFPVYRI